MESLLAVVEDAADDWETADAVEWRVIEELRQMGNEALTVWADAGWRRVSWWPKRSWIDGREVKNSIGTRPWIGSRW
ncbi:MAG: hypothetical protein LM549_08665 [Candidatus Competibacter sp.]|nr:hypothetical protein [Candidatus Competibacter sp.]